MFTNNDNVMDLSQTAFKVIFPSIEKSVQINAVISCDVSNYTSCEMSQLALATSVFSHRIKKYYETFISENFYIYV